MRPVIRTVAALALALPLLAGSGCAADKQAEETGKPGVDDVVLPEDLPGEFEQLIRRGGIASIDEPVFVAAADAEVADEAWMLGVVVEGQAKAYSLNLLNRHEIVNDRSGERSFAAVW